MVFTTFLVSRRAAAGPCQDFQPQRWYAPPSWTSTGKISVQLPADYPREELADLNKITQWAFIKNRDPVAQDCKVLTSSATKDTPPKQKQMFLNRGSLLLFFFPKKNIQS